MKKPFLVLLSIALFGCPATPKIIDIQYGNENQLNCEQLNVEINSAEQAKIDAHEEDHFRFSDIFPPTGIISVANIWRAGSHATERLALLNNIAKEKGCLNHPYSSNSNEIILAQYIPATQPEILGNNQLNEQNISQESKAEEPSENKAEHQQEASASTVPVADDSNKLEEDYTKDQDSAAYVKKGYDSEVYPHIVPDAAIPEH